jgi:solute carrier family 50 protein (sugar transporter)
MSDTPSLAFILADYVAPTIGCILSTLTFSAPIKSLLTAIKSGSLGSLNPTPWAFMTGNTIGWLAYSFITLDLFVFFANAPGLLISIWLNTGAMKLQYYEELVRRSSSENSSIDGDNDEISVRTAKIDCCQHLTSHELKVLQIILIWVIILSTTSLIPVSIEEMKFIVGVAVNINLIFFYAAPLSTIATVIRTKNSASIHFWTMAMNTANAFFWCVYSLAIQDFYILIPNGLGFLFGLIQVALYQCFPRSEVIESSDSVTELSGEEGDCTEQLTRAHHGNDVESEII